MAAFDGVAPIDTVARIVEVGHQLQRDAEVVSQPLHEPRRDLGKRSSDPEVGLTLPETQATVLEAIEGLPLTVTRGSAVSSVVGVLEGARPGPTVLLRGDMDALPMQEETGLPFASQVEGRMHACGHDAHSAMLVGAARALCAHR